MKNIFKLFLLICFFTTAHFSFAQTEQIVDSLEKKLPSLSGKEKCIALSDLAFYAGYYDLRKSEKYSNEMLNCALQLRDSALVGEAYNGIAIHYLRIGNLDSSLYYNFMALGIRKKLNDKTGMISSYSKIGNIYADQSSYELALYYHQQGLKYAEETNDRLKISKIMNNLSSLHSKLGNHEKSKKYAMESLAIAMQTGDKYDEAMAAGNIGLYYQKSNKPDSSIIFVKRSLAILMEYGSYMDASTAENNLGVAYRMKGDSKTGLQHYMNAYELSKKINDQAGVAQYAANVGGVYNSLKNYNLGKKYFEEALVIAKANSMRKLISQCYDGLSTSYFGMGNIEEALKYKDALLKIRDSILSEEKIKQLADAETKYQSERKEREALEAKANLALEKEAKAIAESQAETRKKWVIGIIAGSVILFLLSTIFVIRKRQKEILAFDAEIIRQREAGLRSVLIATEEERKRIARELHDGIGQQLGGLKLSMQNFQNTFAKENEAQKTKLHELTKILDDAAVEVRSISHQMMPKVLSEVGLAPAIEDMLKKTFGSAGIKYEFETFGLDQRYGDAIEISLYRISQELVTNIIKHANASFVNVQLFRNKNNLILIVEDNGKGFDFNAKKEGIGLLNITSRLSTVKGEVNYEAGPVSGTIASVRVPIS